MKQEQKTAMDQWINKKLYHAEVTPPESVWQHILDANIRSEKPKRYFPLRYAAAILAIVCSLAVSFYIAYQNQQQPAQTIQAKQNEMPEDQVATKPEAPKVVETFPLPESPKKKLQPAIITEKDKSEAPLEQPVLLSPSEKNSVTETVVQEEQNDAARVNYPVHILRIIPNENPVNDEIQVISPQVIKKEKKRK